MKETFVPTRYSMAGVIGVGKTTLAKRLAEHLRVDLTEELDGDNSLLKKFYANMKEYAFELQIHLLAKRSKSMSTPGSCIFDRSLIEDTIFARLLTDNGNMTESQFKTYISIRDQIISRLTTPTTIIYLRVKPETALARIRERNREFEKSIGIEYITELCKRYDDFMALMSKSMKVITVDWESFMDIDSLLKLLK